MRPEPHRSVLRWASECVVTAERAGVALLVLGTVALMAAFLLPWWSLRREGIIFVNPTVVGDGFSGWGWLSFAAGLVVLALTVRLVIEKGTSLGARLDNRMLAWIAMVAESRNSLAACCSSSRPKRPKSSSALGRSPAGEWASASRWWPGSWSSPAACSCSLRGTGRYPRQPNGMLHASWWGRDFAP